METVMLFLCVCAATVLTNGLILYVAARYFLKGLEAHGKLEYERLMAIQEKGAEALNRLTGQMGQQRTSKVRGFGDNGPTGGGSA